MIKTTVTETIEKYDEDGNLDVVEDEEELAMIDEVVAAFDGEEDE